MNSMRTNDNHPKERDRHWRTIRGLFGSAARGFTVISSSIIFTAAVYAQADSRPGFEVASIKLTPPAQIGYMAPAEFGTDRYTTTNVSLDALVQVAYGMPYNQISGVEKLGTQHYDLTAKAEDGAILTPKTIQPRLQRLLEERFKLVVHRGTKQFDGYALVVAKGGAKLKATAGSKEMGAVFPGGMRLPNTDMAGLATMLASSAGRPVVDKTGISGSYDVDIRFARDNDTDSQLPSLFTALQEQLGLKLESQKVPVEMLVIDSVNRTPSEN